jgi:hypothetical protein
LVLLQHKHAWPARKGRDAASDAVDRTLPHGAVFARPRGGLTCDHGPAGANNRFAKTSLHAMLYAWPACPGGCIKGTQPMPYATVTHWNATEWTDEMEATARNKFVPLVMSVGASKVNMVRTGDLSSCVITEYSDAATAQSAQDRIAEIRAQAASELPMTMLSAHAGPVFASG